MNSNDTSSSSSVIAEKLLRFEKIDLDGMDDVQLLNRVDQKYVVPIGEIPEILDRLAAHYKVLTIDDHQVLEYESVYFDTPDFQFYRQHHNGRLSRHKVRYRIYKDTNDVYLEVKHKNNHGRTMKQRIRKTAIEKHLSNESILFIQQRVPLVAADRLNAETITSYRRITLVNKLSRERTTVDIDLRFQTADGQTRRGLSFMAVIESKQERASRSPVVQLMRDMNYFPDAFSKYCIASALLYPELRYNRFKHLLSSLNKMSNGFNHAEQRVVWDPVR